MIAHTFDWWVAHPTEIGSAVGPRMWTPRQTRLPALGGSDGCRLTLPLRFRDRVGLCRRPRACPPLGGPGELPPASAWILNSRRESHPYHRNFTKIHRSGYISSGEERGLPDPLGSADRRQGADDRPLPTADGLYGILAGLEVRWEGVGRTTPRCTIPHYFLAIGL